MADHKDKNELTARIKVSTKFSGAKAGKAAGVGSRKKVTKKKSK